ncbi:MAG TPA: class I SAM-dependent methyltransferase [Mycobacteriales bacterium]|nr:class I SAM-dependent methyltransferase [Mycobacteriales bacterium]
MDTAAAWESNAEDWIKWTDPANERDGFAPTTWPGLRDLLPAPAGVTLDIGCGEGRGARQLTALGYRVVGVDRSPSLVRAARERGSTAVLADAARLPVASGAVALAFASMSLLDIEDLDSAVSEIDRVLSPTGVLVAAIVHPAVSMFDPARMRTGDLQLVAPYLEARRSVDRIERGDLAMTFESLHRPLSAYFEPLLSRGFAITGFREDGQGPVPWMLAFRAERR